MPSSEIGFGASYGSGEAGLDRALGAAARSVRGPLLAPGRPPTGERHLRPRPASRPALEVLRQGHQLAARRGQRGGIRRHRRPSRRGDRRRSDGARSMGRALLDASASASDPLAETTDGPALPAHLTTRGVVEIEVLPITRRRAAGADPPTPARRPTQPELRSCHSNVGGGCHTQICTGFFPCGGAGGRHSDKESSSTTSGEGFPTGYPLENQSPPI